jgi:7-cyano-7-deazaguanine synthase in queuosine biosynthesis
MNSIESLVVLKRLSIKNISIEPKKVKAEYCVEKFSGETESYDLIYSYDYPWFDKSDPADVNLASMMLAQVALNYGLFFEVIEFEGLFDRNDQRFIADMMENTSREILTNKLLIKNEFIKAPYHELKAEKRNSYTLANLLFINSSDMLLVKEQTIADHNTFAILSSGGKDSLLTYGILKEIGEVYPVFINEAGRHWFTAVNAYRHFKEIEENTKKPWCNSDRLFSWMLKQLPFIREDYASIRADIYPVRLWTVAVFLFGVLPIARKMHIGNIIIGDEYDTTVLGNLNGISHYSGLYDQSKYFDNAMSRYYKSKGWDIHQYSILRSMSELLIMKMLVKRYPDLQQHQVSCHAAHEVDGRMYPCGKCEKCRRIIGMLKALDENPERCGYNEEQIAAGLKALEKQSVKQIGSDAAHLYYLLLSKKLITRNEHSGKLAREHPQITKLRFDAERSNPEDLPLHIRQPLFNLLIQYADGAAKRMDNRWIDFELTDIFLNEKIYKLDDK